MVRLGVAGRAVAQPRTSAMCVVCDMQANNNLEKIEIQHLIYQEVKTNTLAPLIGEN